MIVRDHMGKRVAAMCFTRMGYVEPAVAKALAGLEATKFIRGMGQDWVQLVGDAKTVVDTVTSGETDWSYKGQIIEAIWSNIRRFPYWTFTHVHRGANLIAHALAKLATKQFMENVWFMEPPTCIRNLIVSKQYVVHS